MFFNKKSSKHSAILTRLVAVFMAVIIFSLLTGAVIDIQAKQVTLVMVDAFADSEKTQELTTRQNTVSEFLEENDIKLGEYDRASMLLEDELYSGARVVIRKGRKLTLNIDGNVEIITTTKKTVREAFEEAGVSVNDIDRVEPGLDDSITENMMVSVYRVQNKQITVDSEIPFTSREVSDSSLEKGKTQIKVRGVNGLKRTTYDIRTENGKETNREVVSQITVKEPTTQVVAVGTKTIKKATAKSKTATKKTQTTKAAAKTSTKTESGKSLNYSKKLTVTATAYSASAGSKTASGKPAQYGVIAVDPKVIPLGTRLYVESTDDGKSWTYGYCVAGDTGGAIKGNKIDLFFNSDGECIQFGRRKAIVYVLN